MTLTAASPRELRSYQATAVERVENDWADGSTRVGVVLPTGSGKSTVIGKLASNAYRRGQRVVLLAHRGELLDQMLRDLRAVDPAIPAADMGLVRAEQDEHDAPIVAATLQTLATAHRRRALGKRDVILWDEVHHAGAEGFHATFAELGGYDDAFMAGFTATMYRNERGVIGLGDVIQKVSYERDLKWAIKQGFLVQPTGLTVRVAGLDALNDVRTVAGDFHQGDLAEVMEAATDYVVDAVTTHAADRRPIIFAASVAAAHHIAESLTVAGYPAVAVTGGTGYDDRKPFYDAYRNGDVRALVTVMVLTEGADFPMCDAVVLARPTRSKNLYSQMIGRSLRLFDGKDDALVLDLSGSARQMKLVSLTQLDTGATTTTVDTDGNVVEDVVADEAPAKIVRQGPVDMVSIDLLANDDTLWLETPGGVPFIGLRDGELVFLWPRCGACGRNHAKCDITDNDTPHSWAVGQINTRTGKGGWVTGSGRFAADAPQYVDLPTALDSAEVWIVESEQIIPSRNAGWRRSQAPSEAQVNLARTLGIPGYADMTKARLSDEISIKFASRALDRRLEK